MTGESSKRAILRSRLAAALARVQPGRAVADVLALETFYPAAASETGPFV